MIVEIDSREPKEFIATVIEIAILFYDDGTRTVIVENDESTGQPKKWIVHGSSFDVIIIVKNLGVGDLHIIDNDNRDIRPLTIERKGIKPEENINDMLASRNDGRWDSQRENMMDHNENILYIVTGSFDSMPRSDRMSVITYMTSLLRVGIRASWLPSDKDLVMCAFRFFEIRPEYIPTHKINSDRDKKAEKCARIFYQQEGISKETALGMAKFEKVPDHIGKMTIYDLSHMIRKTQGKEEQPKPLQVAVEFFCDWHNLEIDRFVEEEKARLKTEKLCRYCGGKGSILDLEGQYVTCKFCDGSGKVNRRER